MIQYALLICYLYSINTPLCKGNSLITGGNNHLKTFLITMNYAQKYDLFFPFFIKAVVNKSQAYSFLIIGMMHLQKILLSVIMLRFHFFTAKQGTWVHKDDRGPLKDVSVSPNNFCLTWSNHTLVTRTWFFSSWNGMLIIIRQHYNVYWNLQHFH